MWGSGGASREPHSEAPTEPPLHLPAGGELWRHWDWEALIPIPAVQALVRPDTRASLLLWHRGFGTPPRAPSPEPSPPQWALPSRGKGAVEGQQ